MAPTVMLVGSVPGGMMTVHWFGPGVVGGFGLGVQFTDHPPKVTVLRGSGRGVPGGAAVV